MAGDSYAEKGFALPWRRQRASRDYAVAQAANAKLVDAHLAAGRLDEVVAVQSDILRLCEEMLGPRHPETIAAMENLAESCRSEGMSSRAIELQEQVVASLLVSPAMPSGLQPFYRQTLQLQNHARNLRAKRSLGILYYEAGRGVEALPLLEEGLGGYVGNAPEVVEARVQMQKMIDRLRSGNPAQGNQ